MHNNYTYRHSDLPSVRPEIQAEIVALDVQIADLILKSQGNYRELEQLAEVLDSGLDTCELNLQSIRIIADNAQQPPVATLKDLRLEDKRLIYGISFTNSVLLNLLSNITGKEPQRTGEEIAVFFCLRTEPPTRSEVEEVITKLISAQSKAKDGFVF